MRITWLLYSLILSLALAYLQHLAILGHWFFAYPWFDTVLHTLGGAAIGTLVISLFHGRFRPGVYLALVIIAVAGWEVFEYFIGSPRAYNFLLDTASDLLSDTIGALAAYLLARFTIWRSV